MMEPIDSQTSTPSSATIEQLEVSGIPSTQRAWRELRRGQPNTSIELQSNVPVSTQLAPGEILIKTTAAALNPAGYKLLNLLPNAVAKRPKTIEMDFTGKVVAVRGVTGSTDVQVGSEVFGWIPNAMSQVTSQGALSEYIRIKADHVVHKPKNISAAEAAGIATCGITAWQMLFQHAKIKAGDHIFVNGGTSSVGLYAIQIAKAHGCKVTATTSGKNYGFVQGLGVDKVVDYTQIDSLPDYLAENVPQPILDAIVDCIGNNNELYTASAAYLKPGGVVVSTGVDPTNLIGAVGQSLSLAGSLIRPKWLGGVDRKFSFVLASNSRDDLHSLAKLIEEGKVKPFVDSVYRFEDALEAYERIMSKHTRGKVVVAIDPSITTQEPPENPTVPGSLE